MVRLDSKHVIRLVNHCDLFLLHIGSDMKKDFFVHFTMCIAIFILGKVLHTVLHIVQYMH